VPNYKLHIKIFISFHFFLGTQKFLRDKHDFIFSMGKPTSKPMLSCSFPSSCFFFSKSLSYFKDKANKPNPLFWSWFHSSSNHFSSLYRNLRYAFNTRWWWNLFTKFRLDTNLLMTTNHKNTTFFPTLHGQITTSKFINTQDPSQATNQGTLDYHHFSFYYHQWIKIHISHDFSFSFYSWTRFSLANTFLQFPHILFLLFIILFSRSSSSMVHNHLGRWKVRTLLASFVAYGNYQKLVHTVTRRS